MIESSLKSNLSHFNTIALSPEVIDLYLATILIQALSRHVSLEKAGAQESMHSSRYWYVSIVIAADYPHQYIDIPAGEWRV